MNLRNLPVLGRPSKGRLAYRTSPTLRVLFLVAAIGLSALGATWTEGDGMTRLLFYSAALILAMSSLTENRWVFFAPQPSRDGEKEAGAGGVPGMADAGQPAPRPAVRRSFGVIPVMRSFELPADRLYSISLRAGKGGESLFGHSGDGEKIQASIHGMNRHAWVALVLGLTDGKSLVLAAGKRGQHGRLRQDGMAIAAHLGLAFEDGGAEASPEPPTPPPSTPPTTSA